jgi:hypothetical protein
MPGAPRAGADPFRITGCCMTIAGTDVGTNTCCGRFTTLTTVPTTDGTADDTNDATDDMKLLNIEEPREPEKVLPD